MNKLIVITGPTASGKTKLAAHVCYHIQGEIISADSRQVYKHMDIGTGKDKEDYKVYNQHIKAHLIDIHQPGYKYNIFEYQGDFNKAFENICARGKVPVVCGGSVLYIDAVTKGYKLLAVPPNPQLRAELEIKSMEELTELLRIYKSLHNKTDIDTKKRAVRAIEIAKYEKENPTETQNSLNLNPLYIGVLYERTNERNNIAQRLRERLKSGLIEEAENLIKLGLTYDDLLYYGLEYKFLALYLKGDLDRDTMEQKLCTAICQFSKRQRTWFRKMEREGVKINWIEGEQPFETKLEKALQLTENYLVK